MLKNNHLFQELVYRSSELGNHFKRYIDLIRSVAPELENRLAISRTIEGAENLWALQDDFYSGMSRIADLAENRRELENFLGCYFAIQMIRLNLRTVDRCRDVTPGVEDRFGRLRQTLIDTETGFSRLGNALIRVFVESLAEPEELEHFIIINVGSQSDMEDIDVGIIDDGVIPRERINKIISDLGRAMLRKAIPLHAFLAERILADRYSAAPEVYERYLRKHADDFVAVSEILSGDLIVGGSELFDGFRRTVVFPYFYAGGRNFKHEGFVRSIAGEARRLLSQDYNAPIMDPKGDCLRVIKGLLAAVRTVYGIEESEPFRVLSLLKEIDSGNRDLYAGLERGLAFAGMFWHMYQIVIMPDPSPSNTDDPIVQANLDRLAKTMGYRSMKGLAAWRHLLANYNETALHINRLADRVLSNLIRHLKTISAINYLAPVKDRIHSEEEGYRNIVFAVLDQFARFRQSFFWDDLMDLLDQDNSLNLRIFLFQLKRMRPRVRIRLLRRLYVLMRDDARLMLRFLSILLHSGFPSGADFGETFLRWWLPDLRTNFNVADSFFRTLIRENKLGLQWILKIPLTQRNLIVGAALRNTQMEVTHWARLYLLFCTSSAFFISRLEKVLLQYDEAIFLLKTSADLHQLASKVYGNLLGLQDIQQRQEILARFFQIEFVRMGLLAREGSYRDLSESFAHATQIYLRDMFKLARENVDARWKGDKPEGPLPICVFLTGGAGEYESFIDDFDILAVSSAKGKNWEPYFNAIIQNLTRWMAKIGILPHFHFSEIFNRYWVDLDDLIEWSRQTDGSPMVEMAQCLEAKLLVGSFDLNKRFRKEMVEGWVLERADDFVNDIICEIESKDKDYSPEEGTRNIKNAPGGIRDIRLIIQGLRARYGIVQTNITKTISILCKKRPEKAKMLRQLFRLYHFFVRLRGLFRVLVANADEVDRNGMDHVARLTWRTGIGIRKGEGRILTALFDMEIAQSHAIICEIKTWLQSDRQAF